MVFQKLNFDFFLVKKSLHTQIQPSGKLICVSISKIALPLSYNINIILVSKQLGAI